MKCERCVVNDAAVFVIRPPWNTWTIECPWCETTTQEYHVPIEDLMRSPRSVLGWLQHLSGKRWYRVEPFVDVLTRYGCEVGAEPGLVD